MIDLNQIIDAFEEAVAVEGVLAVDPTRFAPSKAEDLSSETRSRIIVELLRVWMEYRWKSQSPVTAIECMELFPHETFAKVDLESLQYEEQRQRLLYQSRTFDRSGKRRSVEQLPDVNTQWGDFYLLQVLGQGAFAKVYLARQGDLADRLVALKLTYRETQEANWLARLQHSSIVPIYSVHRIDEVYGICMPYLGNSTLADLVKELPRSVMHGSRSLWQRSRYGRSGTSVLSTIRQRHSQIDTLFSTGPVRTNSEPKSLTKDSAAAEKSSQTSLASNDSSYQIPVYFEPSIEENSSPTSQFLANCDYVDAIAWIGAQLADALAYSHRLGILHCDIKPANILLARDGQPRLLDFNVSHANQGAANLEGPMGGTIPYMSPEHRRAIYGRDHIDAKSDIYSLGVVLFEMLTGTLPDPTTTLQDTEGSSARMRTNPRAINGNVSCAMNAIVSKCLQSDPGKRYQTADELWEDLNAHCNNQPLIHQREPSYRERLLKWSRRHPRLSSATSISLVAASIFLAGCFAFLSRERTLQQVNWERKLSVLEQRIPASIALLTSMNIDPHLRDECSKDLSYTLSLMFDESSPQLKIDPRWLSNQSVRDQSLRGGLAHLINVSKSHPWRDPNTEPVKDSIFYRLDRQFELVEKTFGSNMPTIGSNYSNLREQILSGKLDKVREILVNRSSEQQHSYTDWWLLGDCYFHLGEYELAQQAFTACIALRPEISIAYFNRGLARTISKKPALAAEDFLKTTELSPEWQWARFNRAHVLRDLGKIEEAVAELNKAIDRGFRSVSLFRLRSELHELQNQPELAKADLRKALQCVPISDQDWMDRGLIRIASDPASAAADFERALVLSPNSIDAHQKLAYVYSELLGQPDKSLEHLDALVELAKTQVTHRAGRAVVHARARRMELALMDLQNAEQQPNTDPIAMYQIASGYSILLANAEKGKDELESKTLHWIAQALLAQPQLASLMEADQDLAAVSSSTSFHELLKSAKVLMNNASPLSSSN